MKKVKENSDDLSAHDIYHDIKMRSKTFKTKVNEKTITVINLSDVISLAPIEEFVEQIKQTDYFGFKKYEASRNNGFLATSFKEGKLGSNFKLINSFIRTAYMHEHFYVYSENVLLFTECCKEMKLTTSSFIRPDYHLVEIERYEADIYNDLIELIRKKSQTKEFKKRSSNRKSNSDRMYKKLMTYIATLFERYSELLVIKLDLGYLNEMDNGGKAKEIISLEQARKDFKRLINNKRHNGIFDNMIGYISKLEHVGQSGYHYHLILLYLGSKVNDEVRIGDEVGRYWIDVITRQQGTFVNCNAIRSKSTHPGIGMINAESDEGAVLRSNLNRYVVLCLTKTEQYLKLKLGDKDRVFSMGMLPKIASEVS